MDLILDLAKRSNSIPPGKERYCFAYNEIKNNILNWGYITKTISKSDLVFMKTFIGGEKDLEDDFEKTFGKYIK